MKAEIDIMKIMSLVLCLLGSSCFIYSVKLPTPSRRQNIVQIEDGRRHDCVYIHKESNDGQSKDDELEMVADEVVEQLKNYAHCQELSENRKVILEKAGITIEDDPELKALKDQEVYASGRVREITEVFSKLVFKK